MNILQSVILGIVEGVTEFLPISSTFHLIWTSTFLQLEQSEFVKLFQIFIQSGAILAVIFLYYKEVMRDRILFVKLILSFIPTALIGFIFYRVIKGVFFERIDVTTIAFIIVGILFLITEFFIQKRWLKIDKNMSKLTYTQSFMIGLIQALAVLPGVSRAGAVMVGMMFLGFKRSEAAKYSFMLSVPTILSASLYDLYKMRDVAFANTDRSGILIIGFIVAFASAFVGVRWLIRFLQHNSLALFGWYRVIVGIILLFI